MRFTQVALTTLLIVGLINLCAGPLVVYVPFFNLFRPLRMLITLRMLRRPFPITRRVLGLFLVPMLLRRQDDPTTELEAERLYSAIQRVDSEECLYRMFCELHNRSSIHPPNGESRSFTLTFNDQPSRQLPVSVTFSKQPSRQLPLSVSSQLDFLLPVIETHVEDNKLCDRTKISCPYSTNEIMSALKKPSFSGAPPDHHFKRSHYKTRHINKIPRPS